MHAPERPRRNSYSQFSFLVVSIRSPPKKAREEKQVVKSVPLQPILKKLKSFLFLEDELCRVETPVFCVVNKVKNPRTMYRENKIDNLLIDPTQEDPNIQMKNY